MRVSGARISLLAAGALLALAACASPTPAAAPTPTSPAAFTPTPTATPTPAGPCEEEDIDCSPRDVSGYQVYGRPYEARSAVIGERTSAPTVEEIMEKGLRLAGASPVHIVVRVSGLPNSVRCSWRGIARTPEQREDAIRLWLRLDADDAVPSASYLETLFTATIDALDTDYRETLKSNLLAVARGGLSTDYLFLTCYVEYRVKERLLGAGPLTINVAYDQKGEARSYELYKREHAAGQFGTEALMTASQHQASLDRIAADAVDEITGMSASRESALFLAPMGAHNAIAVEAWQVVDQWELQTQTTDSGAKVVVAARHGAPQDDAESNLPYADLKRRVSAAARTDAFAGKRIANASGITQYYRDIGAYGDITPGDGETTTFTPARTPPHCGLAVGAGASPGLVRDCFALMEGKDTLRGTGSLNWDFGRAIATWDGITVSGTPARVTRLEAQGRKLTGTIPASLGKLSQLTRLYLQDNKLTGSIPPELGDLSNLTHFNLYYNSLSGSIPSELGDLSELRRFYLNSNQLTGSIPSSFGNFSKIWHLYLNDNKLTGSIPTELGNLSTVIHIHLGGNDLSGGVPTWLGNLSRLTWLYLNGNELTGSIPSELGNLSRLLRLSLADNDLSGSIPTQLGNLSKVTHLYLGGNKLTGCVPSALRSVSTNDLSRLSLSNC